MNTSSPSNADSRYMFIARMTSFILDVLMWLKGVRQ